MIIVIGSEIPVIIVSFVIRLLVFSLTFEEYTSKSLSANSLVEIAKLYSFSIPKSIP